MERQQKPDYLRWVIHGITIFTVLFTAIALMYPPPPDSSLFIGAVISIVVSIGYECSKFYERKKKEKD